MEQRWARDEPVWVRRLSCCAPELPSRWSDREALDSDGWRCAVQKESLSFNDLPLFLSWKAKSSKVFVDFEGVNLFIRFLSGAHSASAPTTGIALKQHQLRDWGNPGREVVVSSGLKIEARADTVLVAL